MSFVPCVSIKLLSTVDPKLCTYLQNQAKFRNVSLTITTAIFREDKTKKQSNNFVLGAVAFSL